VVFATQEEEEVVTETCFDSYLSDRPRRVVADRDEFWIQIDGQNLHEFSYSTVERISNSHQLITSPYGVI